MGSRHSGEPPPIFPSSERFELVGEIGRGGMGVVYEVRDRDRSVRLALKGVRNVRSRELLRLKGEFRALRDLQHPNLVRLGELFEHEGACFFTMELVDGVHMLRWVRPSLEGARALDDELVTKGDDGELYRLDDASLETRTAADPIGAMRVEARRAGLASVAEPTIGEAAARAKPDATLDPKQDATTIAPSMGTSGAPDEPAGRRDRGPLGPLELERLRPAFRGLATGVAVLHRAGMVHRDIKPSNILVEPSGRVVLLDFGVVAALSDGSPEDDAPREIVGTYTYMAPEQSTGKDVGPAADWYAVGVVLFEALTGRLPFPGGRGALNAKLAGPAPLVRAFAPDAPADLASLCDRLLRRDPTHRPAEREILATFGIRDEHLSDSGDGSAPSGPFVGRADELAGIRAAFDLAGRQGTAAGVFITGESGIGKTVVMKEFLDGLREQRGDLLVLSGRCDEREIVPYNALDGAVDGLARYLGGVPPDELAIPTGCAALVRLFPVLRGVEPLARAGDRTPATDSTSRSDQRSLAFAALGELLAFATTRKRVVVAIDDIHWADLDSLALLAELMSGGDAPPVFLIATARQKLDAPSCAAINAVRTPSRLFPLRGLSREDAERLLHALAPDASIDTARAGRLVEETNGHPLFLSEMVRRLTDLPGQGELLLDDALWQRTGELPEGARALLEIVALASTSLDLGTAADAAALAPDHFTQHLAELRAARLVRLTGTRDRDAIEPYHDRVREALVARLPAPRQTAVHRSLAHALEGRSAPVEVLAYHFAAAGERDRAAAFAEAAARRAIASLAFERAAVWLRATIEMAELTADRRRGLLGELGEMLARAGRTADAAKVFLEAAEVAQTGVDEGRELRRRAGEQYLIGGHLTEGIACSRALVEEVGIAYPSGTFGAIARLGWYSTRLGWSRMRWKVRAPADVATRDRMRIDLCWSVGCGLSMVDSIRGAVFAFRGPLLAMSGGDPMRISRSLFAAVVAACGIGDDKLARRLLAAAQHAAADTDDPLAGFYADLCNIFPFFFLDNDWASTLASCERAAARWGASGRGHTFEVDVVEQHQLWSLAMLGELSELRRRVPQTIRAAQRVGNRFVEVMTRTWFPHIDLARDRPDAARADVVDAIESWLPGSDHIGNPYFFAMKSRTMCALYQGTAEDEGDQLTADWQRMRKAMLYRIPVVAVESELWIGLLAAGRAAAARARNADPKVHLAAGERALKRIRKCRLPAVPQLAAQVESSLAAARGDDQRAVAILRDALPGFEARGMRALVACARWQLGRTLGGDEGARLVRDAERYFDAEGVVRGDRLVASQLSGWPHPG